MAASASGIGITALTTTAAPPDAPQPAGTGWGTSHARVVCPVETCSRMSSSRMTSGSRRRRRSLRLGGADHRHRAIPGARYGRPTGHFHRTVSGQNHWTMT